MFLGGVFLAAVCMFKCITQHHVMAAMPSNVTADFSAATVPGWLAKLDNPLVLAAFPEAARVASMRDLNSPTGAGQVGSLARTTPTLVRAARFYRDTHPSKSGCDATCPPELQLASTQRLICDKGRLCHRRLMELRRTRPSPKPLTRRGPLPQTLASPSRQ